MYVGESRERPYHRCGMLLWFGLLREWAVVGRGLLVELYGDDGLIVTACSSSGQPSLL